MKKTIKVILICILIFLIIILLSFLISKFTYSKYKTKVKSDAIAQVATPVFVVDGIDTIKINGIEDTEYNFSVRNYDEDNNISEINMDYYVEIQNNSKANLSFALYDEDGNSVPLNNNKSNSFTLEHSVKQIDEYRLVISYQNDTSILDDIEGNVQIKVEAVQSQEVI